MSIGGRYWPTVPVPASTNVDRRRGRPRWRCGQARRKGMPAMFKSTSTSLILLGVLAIIVGIIALAWPGVTILALVILFAIYAFIGAGLQAMRAFSSATAGPVFGHLLLGLVDIAAGVIAIAWPGPTALVLVLVVGIWAFAGGIMEIAAAFGAGETGRASCRERV